MRAIIRSLSDLSSKRRFCLMAESPQKVKNMETSMPMVAAPVAMMKAARLLSRSPEKTTIETLSSGTFSLRAASSDSRRARRASMASIVAVASIASPPSPCAR
ncbi:hypothetical protein D3C87_1855330 [compost metagenome]